MSRIPKRIPVKTRQQLHERANDCCELCGEPNATNAHHRMNRSVGGRHELSNLLLVCGSGTSGCHGWITEHPAWAHRNGYTVKSYETPALKRVHLPGGWALLSDAGDLVYIPAPVVKPA